MITTITCSDCHRSGDYSPDSLQWEFDGPDGAPDFFLTCRFCQHPTGTQKDLAPLISELEDPDEDITYERGLDL